MVGCENENSLLFIAISLLQDLSQAVVRNPSAAKAPELRIRTHCGAYNRGGAVHDGGKLAG